MMKQLALDAGFQHAEIVPTKGHPSVFATLDAGAKDTLGLYFMYDVKQVDRRRVELAAVGREARRTARPRHRPDRPRRDQPEGPAGRFPRRACTRSAAPARRSRSTSCSSPKARRRSARRTSRRSCHDTPQRARRAREVHRHLHAEPFAGTRRQRRRSPSAPRATSSATWSRAARNGAAARRATCTRASPRALDQPAWHLVQALNTLVTPNGDPAVDGFFEHVRPVTRRRARDDRHHGRSAWTRSRYWKTCGAKVWARDAELAPVDRGLRVAADGHDRGPRRRLRRPRRQDHPAAPR